MADQPMTRGRGPQRAAHRQRSRHPHQTGGAPARRHRQARPTHRREESSSSPTRSTRRSDDCRSAIPASPATTSSPMILRPQPSSPTFDADKHAKAEQLDGCYLLKTDRKDLSGDELWRIYISAHPRRECLPRHEIAARRAADLPSPRAPHRLPYLSLCAWPTICSSRSKRPCSTRASTRPGQPCATPSRPIRSAPSSCQPMRPLPANPKGRHARTRRPGTLPPPCRLASHPQPQHMWSQPHSD